MSIPILKQADTLIACVHEGTSDQDLARLRADLAIRVGEFRSSGVIIDVSAVDVLDSFAARMLRDIAAAARLRGAETLIVGIQSELAFAMIRLGLSLNGIGTAHDLEDGLELIARRNKARRGNDR